MAGRRQGDEWPADMERRRIASLEKFQRDHPDYVFRVEHLPGTNWSRSGGEKCDTALRRPFPSAKTAGRQGNNTENRWCTATTLELLDEMKAFVRANKLPCLGEGIERWKKIAIHLSNPCGLELRRLARSSMVRFDNLRRNYRTHLRLRMDQQIQDSMIDYFRTCELYKPPGSTPASTLTVVSTMSLALAVKRPSPSPPSTPAMKKPCRRHTSSDSGHPMREHEDDSMSSVDGSSGDEMEPSVDDISGDETKPSASDSSGGRDDEAVYLSVESGSSHPSLINVDTPIRLLPPPAATTESSDQESAECSHSSFSSEEIRNASSSQRQLRTSTVMQRKRRKTVIRFPSD